MNAVPSIIARSVQRIGAQLASVIARAPHSYVLRALVVLVALGGLLLPTQRGIPTAHASDTVINFSDLPSFTILSNQYASLGVTFGIGPKGSQGGTLHTIKGTSQSVATNFFWGEICSFDAFGAFSTTRQHVGVLVGDEGGQSYPIALTAYDASGNRITSDQLTLSAGSTSVNTQLSVSSSTANIAFFEISLPDGQPNCPHTAITNLSFDSPATPPGPDFGFTPTNVLSVGVPQGGQSENDLILHRVNGSIGNIQFSVIGLPSGVTADFAPNPTNGGEGATVALTLTAGASAPLVQNQTVTLLGTPLVKSAGTQSHSTAISVTVEGVYQPMVTGIEVTQGVQIPTLPTRDPASPSAPVTYNGVSLQEGGKTVVRVFADTPGAPKSGIPGETMLLSGFDDANKPLPGSPLSAESGPSGLIDFGCTVPQGGACDSVRTNANDSYDFTLPAGWASGTISLQAQLLPPFPGFLQTPQYVPCSTSQCAALLSLTMTGVSFTRTGQVGIRPLQFVFNSGCSEFATQPPAPQAFAPAQNVTPLDLSVPDYVGTIEACDIEHESDTDGDLREDQNEDSISRIQDWASNNPGFGFPVGVATFDVGTTNFGTRTTIPAAVTDYHRPLSSIGHETGHLMGRNHASAGCGGGDNGQAADDWPPDQVGLIQGVGVDRRGSAPYQVIKPATGRDGGSGVYDLMSYCGPNSYSFPNTEPGTWISVRGWNDLINRFAQGQPGQAVPIAQIGSSEPSLDVFGFVGQSVDILSVKPAVGPTAPPGSSPYHLVARDAKGAILADTVMAADRGGHIDQGTGQTAFLTGRVPAAGVAEVDIVRNGVVLAKRVRGPHLPQVSVLTPSTVAAGADGSTVTVRWTSTDPDNKALEAIVQYSADDGSTYHALSVGPNTGQVALPSRLFSASQQGRIRVLINDGLNQVSAVSGRFTALGSAPAVHIVDPAPGQRVESDSQLYLHGEAFDDASNLLGGPQLQWFDGDRALGSGATIGAGSLAPGQHTIRLVARDTRGRARTAFVQVMVVGAQPHFLLLNAPKLVDRRATSLTLQVASTIPAGLIVDGIGASGGRFTVGRQPERIAVHVTPGVKDVVLSLRLTANGKTSPAVLDILRRQLLQLILPPGLVSPTG